MAQSYFKIDINMGDNPPKQNNKKNKLNVTNDGDHRKQVETTKTHMPSRFLSYMPIILEIGHNPKALLPRESLKKIIHLYL